MTVKVVRMVNGEDVIADIKEIRKDEETPGAVAYMFEKQYSYSKIGLFAKNRRVIKK